MRKHKGMAAGWTSRQGSADPILLIGKGAVVVVAIHIELIEQHERGIAVLKRVRHAIVGGVDSRGCGEIRTHGKSDASSGCR